MGWRTFPYPTPGPQYIPQVTAMQLCIRFSNICLPYGTVSCMRMGTLCPQYSAWHIVGTLNKSLFDQ